MALYQGEDIAISLSGKDIVDLYNNNFIVLIYSESCKSSSIVIKKSDFEAVQDENDDFYYVYSIPHNTTKNMSGTYTLEIMIEEDGNSKKRSIFIKPDAFFVECSRIKDYANNLDN